jgi:molybdate transport system ATP-binding protein
MSLEVDIRKTVGDFTLDVRLKAEKETLALLGASGCGKSLMLRCLAGIETPDEGYISLGGSVLFDSHKKIDMMRQKRNTEYLYQNATLFQNQTVWQNVTHGLRNKKNRRQMLAEAGDMLELMDLKGLEQFYPKQLSDVQRQCVALARIFVSEPQMVLLDEPFYGIDSHLKWIFEWKLHTVLKQFGGVALLTSSSRDECSGSVTRSPFCRTGPSRPAATNGIYFTIRRVLRPVRSQAAKISPQLSTLRGTDCSPGTGTWSWK